MGTLYSDRTSNATKIGQTDDWNAELEEDIAEILGVAIDHAISSPIFASQSVSDDATYNPDSGSVNADGSITGVLRFLTHTATAVLAAGIEFQSSNDDRYKLACTSAGLELYEWDSGTESWTLLSDLTAGIGSFLGLEDVDEADYTGHAGDFVVVNATEDGLEFSTIAPTATVAALEDIGDVPAYPIFPNPSNQFLKLSVPAGTLSWVESDPGAGAQNIGELDDVDNQFIPAEGTQMGVAEITNGGTPGVPSWEVQAVPQSWAYAISIGLNYDDSLTYFNTADPDKWKIYDNAYKYVYFNAGVNDGVIGCQTHKVFNGGVMGDDLCKISCPNNLPGIWRWSMEIGWANQGESGNFGISFVTEVSDPENKFEMINTTAYHTPPWYSRFINNDTQFTWYPFPNGGYFISRHTWFTHLHEETAASPTFKVGIKSAKDGVPDLSINSNHKINLFGIRVR